MSFTEFLEMSSGALTEGSVFSLLIALIAGVISSGVCPCTLPVGLGLAGLVSSNTRTSQTNHNGVLIAIAFSFGILVTLSALGAVVGGLSVLLTETFGKYWALVMAVISAIAAVVAFNGPRLKVAKLETLRKPGLGGTFLYGVIFSLGTSAAPLLLLISVAAATANLSYGLMLAFAFGLGRALPFLLIGFFASAITKLARLSWLRVSIQWVSSAALAFVSFYYGRIYTSLI
jgi:cytochrome c-type biogenesis protein